MRFRKPITREATAHLHYTKVTRACTAEDFTGQLRHIYVAPAGDVLPPGGLALASFAQAELYSIRVPCLSILLLLRYSTTALRQVGYKATRLFISCTPEW